MISELYDARMRMYRADPGSREWWTAIRDIRAYHQRLRDAVQVLVTSFLETARTVLESLQPLAELFAEVSANG